MTDRTERSLRSTEANIYFLNKSSMHKVWFRWTVKFLVCVRNNCAATTVGLTIPTSVSTLAAKRMQMRFHVWLFRHSGREKGKRTQ